MAVGLCLRWLCAAGFVLGFAQPVQAGKDEPHCPAATPRNSRTFCDKGCDMDADKVRLEMLAEDIAKGKSSVCLLGRIDPRDPKYSRKLAIKRILWVRDMLVAKGVKTESIAIELRPSPVEIKRINWERVDIIFGR
jgi:hypothetical protein